MGNEEYESRFKSQEIFKRMLDRYQEGLESDDIEIVKISLQSSIKLLEETFRHMTVLNDISDNVFDLLLDNEAGEKDL